MESAAKILAVDDVEAKRYSWQKILTRAGFKVFTASTGREALELVQDQPDLVILDVRMPDMDGLEVCRRIKDAPSTSTIPVLHVSASLVSSEDRVNALEGGADGYLTEPVEPEVLVASVKALLRMRRAEEAARAAAREWRTTFDAIQDGVLLLDAQGTILRHNAAFTARFGERVGGDGREFLRGELKFDRVLSGTARQTVELPWTDRWLRLTLDPVVEAAELRGWSCIVSDITERKTAETVVQAMNATLERKVDERTDRLQSAVRELEAFTYTIAHDLRAPLRSMHRYSELLISDYRDKLEPDGADYARRIIAGAERMDTLINDLLEYSRLAQSELKPRPLALSEIAAEVCRPPEGAPDAEVVVDPGMPEVVADRVLLSQVLLNLFTNALKFVAPGTSPKVRVSASREGGRVVVSMTDNGIGIPPESRSRLFKVFERLVAAKDYPGTGIGLAIVRRAMDRMGGEFGVESEPGRGSRFWISLPAAGVEGPR